jgi:hypothetical protein
MPASPRAMPAAIRSLAVVMRSTTASSNVIGPHSP